MFPILVIAIGLAVLALGKRLAVLGAAVGALLGVGLLNLFPGSATPLTVLLIPGLLAVIGFFVAGFAKGIVDIVLLVLGALAGAAIVLGFLNLFNLTTGLIVLLLAVLGGVVGLVLVRRFKDWAMIILAGLIGGLLVTRGLTIWLPFLQGAIGTLLVIVLAGVGIAYQGGFTKSKPAPVGD
jgi:asparagine N-glycosylation enzyme membrane subunit Stt3